MPIGRKHASTSKASASGQLHDDFPKQKTHHSSVSATEEVDAPGAPLPRHPLWPELPPAQGELFFECTLFLYSVLAMLLQYLNLYKTMWWLPNSYTPYALKYHLIDLYLLSCVGLILGRRVTWCFLKKLSLAPLVITDGPLPKYAIVIEWILKCPAVCAILSSFSFSFYQVLSTYSYSLLIYLMWPTLFYVLLFYNEMAEVICDKTIGGWRLRLMVFVDGAPYFVDSKTLHACSYVAKKNREEASILVKDLSQRVKHTIYAAFTTSYFAIFIPTIFAPGALYIDYWWVAELCLVVFFTSASLYLSYLLPLQYCNLLQRAAAHLGAWHKLEKSLHGLPLLTWTENDIWSDGCVVRHGRHSFRGEGVCVSAEPGNLDHNRFYFLMNDPLRVINYFCLLQALLILIQFLMLIHSTDWQHIVTLVLLMFANYVLLFKLFKDKVILGRIYNQGQK